MKFRQITKNIGLSIFLLMLASCVAKQDNFQPSNKVDNVLNKLNDLSSFLSKLETENPRFAELNQKAKKGTLTVVEEKEAEELTNKAMAKFFAENAKPINKDDYKIIVFEEDRCKKCHKITKMAQEIGHDLNIEVDVLNPKGFDAYIKERNLVEYLAASFWQKVFLDPVYLNKAIENNSFPIMLLSTKKGIITISNVKIVKVKSELQDEIKVSLRVWGWLE